MIEQMRELFQHFIAPQLESIRGDVRAVDVKVDTLRRELLSEIHRVEEVLSADYLRLEQKVDLKLENFDTKLGASSDSLNEKMTAMNEKLELHRRELLAEVKAALK
jgi:hypothetical protein